MGSTSTPSTKSQKVGWAILWLIVGMAVLGFCTAQGGIKMPGRPTDSPSSVAPSVAPSGMRTAVQHQ